MADPRRPARLGASAAAVDAAGRRALGRCAAAVRLLPLQPQAPEGCNRMYQRLEPCVFRSAFRAWLNYLAMCAGLGAPGTLAEIARGYFGDATAPERFAADAVVTAGPVTIGPGVGPVKLGPLEYTQWWEDEAGYQRPVELATVRLRNMVEVLSRWDTYVTNRETVALRGATYLFDETGEVLYAYRHRGVLTYSETMPRPLSFLAPYIGDERARNPLRLGDATLRVSVVGRGVLKPAGRAMALLAPLFRAQNALQASLLGVDAEAREEARAELTATVAAHTVVVYTYGLSPFSAAAVALLEAEEVVHEAVPLGGEWFLLGKRGSDSRLQSAVGPSALPIYLLTPGLLGACFHGGGLAILACSARPRGRGWATGRVATASGARASRLHSADSAAFSRRLWPRRQRSPSRIARADRAEQPATCLHRRPARGRTVHEPAG